MGIRSLLGPPHIDRRKLKKIKGFRRFSLLPPTATNHLLSVFFYLRSGYRSCFIHDRAGRASDRRAEMPLKSTFPPRHGSTYLFQEKRDLKAVSGCFSHIETGRAIGQHVDHKLNRRNTCCMCKKCAKQKGFPPPPPSKEPYTNEINALYVVLSWDLGRRMFADQARERQRELGRTHGDTPKANLPQGATGQARDQAADAVGVWAGSDRGLTYMPGLCPGNHGRARA